MYYSFGTSQTVFSAFHGSNVPAVATLRRKRRSTTIPNAKKMFEEVSKHDFVIKPLSLGCRQLKKKKSSQQNVIMIIIIISVIIMMKYSIYN